MVIPPTIFFPHRFDDTISKKVREEADERLAKQLRLERERKAWKEQPLDQENKKLTKKYGKAYADIVTGKRK